MITKDVEIEFNGKKETVKLKRLGFGEKNQLQEEATDIKVIGGQPVVKVSTSKLKELALLKSIVSAPFPITIQAIKELEQEVGDFLFEEYDALNKPKDAKSVS